MRLNKDMLPVKYFFAAYIFVSFDLHGNHRTVKMLPTSILHTYKHIIHDEIYILGICIMRYILRPLVLGYLLDLKCDVSLDVFWAMK